MKKQPPAAERESLASPFEVAQIAISLAIMRGEIEPDLEGGMALLKCAALRVQNEKRPRLSTFVLGQREISLEKARAFPGGDKIIIPKGEHFTLPQIVRAAIGRKDHSRNEHVISKAQKANALTEDEKIRTDFDEWEFWKIVAKIAPFVPRFKELYPKIKARKKPRCEGKFHKSKRAGSGAFKKG